MVHSEALLGTWRSDPSDIDGSREYGDVTLKFGSDGTLLYIVHGAERDQVMRLTYRTEPGILITDQPSEPRAERTRYELTNDGKLVLTFGDRKSKYVKLG